jgi:hypothetical protein
MITDHMLAEMALELNATPDAAARATRYRSLVDETNRMVREAADAVLTLDSSPMSFETLKDRARERDADT